MVLLRDLGEVNRGRSRHRPRHDPILYGGPYPFIQTGDIKASGRRITAFKQTYNEAGLAQSRIWPVGTMCITIAANIAETGILTMPACFPDSVIGFIADDRKCNVRFVEYVFRRLKERIQYEADGSGTVQDNINLAYLDQLRFAVPPLAGQDAIAEVLGALDDKIELNGRMNRRLEALAAGLFRSWFVDFDPVQAKVDGHQPVGVPNGALNLFPEHFEDSREGPIPGGWRLGQLRELASFTRGRSYASSELSDSAVALVTLKSFERGGGYRTGGLKAYTGPYRPEQQIEAGEVVVACTDVTQSADVVGRAARIPAEPDYQTLVASLDVQIVRPAIRDVSRAFLYELLRTDEYVAHAVSRANGTTVLHLGADALPDYCFPLGPMGLIRAFTDLVDPLYAQVSANLIQSRNLDQLRETLLAALLSGEASVGGVEQVVAEVV